jgi:hypothetical protein
MGECAEVRTGILLESCGLGHHRRELGSDAEWALAVPGVVRFVIDAE